MLPSLIFPLPRVIHFVLFEPGGLERAGAFVCLFLFHLHEGTAAIQVMTRALHLGNHFHIQPKQP